MQDVPEPNVILFYGTKPLPSCNFNRILLTKELEYPALGFFVQCIGSVDFRAAAGIIDHETSQGGPLQFSCSIWQTSMIPMDAK